LLIFNFDSPNAPTRFISLPIKLPLKKIEALYCPQTVITDTKIKTNEITQIIVKLIHALLHSEFEIT